jgi:pimeloyl-ACP methyl ester carboxylesterase
LSSATTTRIATTPASQVPALRARWFSGRSYHGRYNPYFRHLDPDRVAIAGHSLGAAAVTVIGQCDKRVKTIVAWDNLGTVKDCSGVTIASENRSKELIHAPALALTNDYGFYPQPMSSLPNPHAKDAGYKQIAAAGEDAQIVAFRNATHLTYSYIPAVLPANELSERMASYYTLAWLDLQLRNDPTGFTRRTPTGGGRAFA